MRFPRPALLLVLLSLLLVRASAGAPLPATTPAAAGFSPDRLARFHANLDGEIDAGRYSGYVVLLARDGKVFDWYAHGWQDVPGKVPLQKDSIVRIFSMTKIVTSVAILTLIEDGKLKLYDHVEKYLPALKDRQVLTGGTADAPVLTPASRPITVHDLLTHTAGYYYDATWSADSPVAIELFQRAKLWDADNLDDYVARVAKIPLHEQPGTRFRYGIAIDLLGAIVEKASGKKFHAYLQERLFGPLGMVDTAFWVPAEKKSRLALVHNRTAGGLVPMALPAENSVGAEHGLQSGGGGLFSTASDYARLAQMLLNGGELDGTRVLSRKSVELMTANHIGHLADPHPFKRPELGFGLGVRMVNDLGRSPFLGSPGMFGWDGAASTLVWMDPQEHLVAILLAQHMPFDEDGLFVRFTNGVYSALEK